MHKPYLFILKIDIKRPFLRLFKSSFSLVYFRATFKAVEP